MHTTIITILRIRTQANHWAHPVHWTAAETCQRYIFCWNQNFEKSSASSLHTEMQLYWPDSMLLCTQCRITWCLKLDSYLPYYMLPVSDSTCSNARQTESKQRGDAPDCAIYWIAITMKLYIHIGHWALVIRQRSWTPTHRWHLVCWTKDSRCRSIEVQIAIAFKTKMVHLPSAFCFYKIHVPLVASLCDFSFQCWSPCGVCTSSCICLPWYCMSISSGARAVCVPRPVS